MTRSKMPLKASFAPRTLRGTTRTVAALLFALSACTGLPGMDSTAGGKYPPITPDPDGSGANGTDGSSALGDPPSAPAPSALPRADGYPSVPPASYHVDELWALPKGTDQNRRFCETPFAPEQDDIVREAFCSGTFPSITNLGDLMGVLGLDPNLGGATKLALAVHTTSISARAVSKLNPRVNFFTDVRGHAADRTDNAKNVSITYVHGEPYVEIAAEEQSFGRGGDAPWNFYLAVITKNCELDGTCTPADYLTDSLEVDWAGVTLYEDHAIQNTTLDCRRCHVQPSRFRDDADRAVLLMEQDGEPWTHWAASETRRSRGPVPGEHYVNALLEFTGGESYGIITPDAVKKSDPEGVWRNLYFTSQLRVQPKFYDPQDVQEELTASGSTACAGSETWQQMFESFRRGEATPPPHCSEDITDPARVAEATRIYKEFRAGHLPADQLVHLGDVFDGSKLVELGHVVEAGATVAATIVNACGQCHNSGLPQELTRARFNAGSAAGLGTSERQAVCTRLTLDRDDPRHMPPTRFLVLSDSAQEQINAFFCGYDDTDNGPD